MGIDIEDIIRLRPYLFHLTDSRNADRILRTGTLEPASRIMTMMGREDLLEMKRATHVGVGVGSDVVFLRDQAPLYAGNMKLPADWRFETFVRKLNDRVFFWPGSASGPIAYGVRHFNRYEAEEPAILRIRLASLVEANERIQLEVCRYNSGSPRWSRGIPAPRGPSTFLRLADVSFAASQIVEVTVAGPVRLPFDMEIASKPRWPPQTPPLVAGSNSSTWRPAGRGEVSSMTSVWLPERQPPSAASSCRQT
jgi:hypothetical protein